jgi:hypothetical protein
MCEPDGKEELPIRLTEFKVSNHSPLVIPSAAEGSAQCAFWGNRPG